MKRLLPLILLFPLHLFATPAYRSSGTFTAVTTATCTPPMPAGEIANDILLLVVESENQTIALTTANGFVEVTNSPQGAGTAGTDPANSIAVYWKRAVGSDSAPVVTATANHATCQLHAFSGVRTVGNPWDVTAGGTDSSANDTSAVIPGSTTTVPDTLVVLIQGTSNNGTSTANCGAVTNANLTSITERTDNSNTAGLGGGHCLMTGIKAAPGVYANSTLTMAATTFKGAMSIALAPQFGLLVSTSAGSSDGNTVTTSGIDTTSANLLTVAIADYLVDAACTFSDSKSNAWTLRDTRTGTVDMRVRIYETALSSPTVGAAHTFSCTGTQSYPTVAVIAWVGPAVPAFDQKNGTGGASSLTMQAGAIVPTQASTASVAAVATETDTSSINLSFTIREHVALVVDQHFGLGLAYLVQGAAASVNPTWTLTSTSEWAASIANYNAGAAASGLLHGSLTTLGVGK